MKNDMGSTNIKRDLLRKFRLSKQVAENELHAHNKKWGRCLSECAEGNHLRSKIAVLTGVIKTVLEA